MKYRDVREGKMVIRIPGRRRARVHKKCEFVETIDVLWLDTHEVERVDPANFEPDKNETYTSQ